MASESSLGEATRWSLTKVPRGRLKMSQDQLSDGGRGSRGISQTITPSAWSWSIRSTALNPHVATAGVNPKIVYLQRPFFDVLAAVKV